MQSDSRVAWREGLFLRQQHFQQQDRYLEALITARANSLRPYPWGVSQLKINADMAALGKFAVESCCSVASRESVPACTACSQNARPSIAAKAMAKTASRKRIRRLAYRALTGREV